VEKTFYAVAVIEGPGGAVEVDARPSDALSAALLAGARVTARRELFDVPHDAARMMENLAEKFPESAPDIVRAELHARAERDVQPQSATASPTP
jgi:bifunctional DNase/RNase